MIMITGVIERIGGSDMFRLSTRGMHVSVTRLGQKAKRRKQMMRESNPHIPIKKTTALPTVQAISHFDQFYSTVYKTKWNSMRLGLMSPQKYAVIVNNFGDTEATCDMLRSLGCVNVAEEFDKGFSKVEPYIPVYDEGNNHPEEAFCIRNLNAFFQVLLQIIMILRNPVKQKKLTLMKM